MHATHPVEKRERVLICEDETIIRLDLRQLLESAGYEVVAEARDGEEAVELALEHEPDLAIMDVRMPRLDGIEAARRILAERPIPIVMLTAHSHEALVARAVQAGVSGYVVKPFREADLLPAIATARARHEELQALRGRADTRVNGAGSVLDLIRSGRASTRGELVRLTGLSRSTVSQRLVDLVARAYVVPGGESGSTGGRPARTFRFNSGGGVLLAARGRSAQHTRGADRPVSGRARRADLRAGRGTRVPNTSSASSATASTSSWQLRVEVATRYAASASASPSRWSSRLQGSRTSPCWSTERTTSSRSASTAGTGPRRGTCSSSTSASESRAR